MDMLLYCIISFIFPWYKLVNHGNKIFACWMPTKESFPSILIDWERVLTDPLNITGWAVCKPWSLALDTPAGPLYTVYCSPSNTLLCLLVSVPIPEEFVVKWRGALLFCKTTKSQHTLYQINVTTNDAPHKWTTDSTCTINYRWASASPQKLKNLT